MMNKYKNKKGRRKCKHFCLNKWLYRVDEDEGEEDEEEEEEERKIIEVSF